MIPANTRIWIVAGVTDMRRGFMSLSGLVQTVLDQNPLSGNVYVFRGRRGDLVKILVSRWRGALPISEKARSWTFRMAAGREWNGFSDQSAAVDVVRGHRLAPACTHLYAADGGLSYRPSYPLSYSFFYAP